MTTITLTVTGAIVKAEVTGALTSGMVGIPITIVYDEAWDGLSKNLVCRAGEWGALSTVTRTILNVGDAATVAHEVMIDGKTLYLGIEGYRSDGTLVIPTTWAACGEILLGANADADPSAEPNLPIWNQLQAQITQVKDQALTEAQVAALIDAYHGETPDAIPGTSPGGTGLNAAASALLITILRNGVYSTDQSANITALEAALVSGDNGGEEEPGEPDEPVVTLTGISAAYSGGDVAVGTALTDLTGVLVTAYYSGGVTASVLGYTLSGEINEGVNTITVTYQGMRATFAVTGVADSGSDDSGDTDTLLYNWDFTTSLTDTVSGNTASLNGDGVTQDSSGLAINRNKSTTPHYVSFSANIHGSNRRYEFDIAKFTKTSNSNAYFLHCLTMGGLIYYSGKWQFYTSTNWAWIETTLTDIEAFSGKTVSVVINSDYSWDIYLDGVLTAQSGSAVSKSGQALTIGSTTSTAGDEDLLITGFRVYELGGA